MTDAPDFNDLTPPDEQVRQWVSEWNDFVPAELDRMTLACRIAHHAARWGARYGYAIGKQEWPKPITDRRPTEEDGDKQGNVAISDVGFFYLRHWATAAEYGCPWLHTPGWQPRPEPTLQKLQKQALKALDSSSAIDGYRCINPRAEAEIRRALEALVKGEGK